ncbi:uncharacterized protein BDW47DRAFT_114384 [Aspergillus candidus]|uniref:Serine/threonine-protein kinase ppk6 n=1 Tax=Aspergillus candidus TaxID=41067 RepID=A0A2I2EXV8_ASPCN|nr:hypothetical protein BDW47DRAFT_114384 [Aspergillus candidus]PLB33217.1 hypothetical protein BDW47DRAFT_114384 [Aspergillus candidus]
MSADLFAEFGAGASARQTPGTSRQNNQPQTSSLIPDLEGLDLSTNSAHSGDGSTLRPVQPRTLTGHAAPSSTYGFAQPPHYGDNDGILFDASFEETVSSHESDDWGEFEAPEPPSVQSLPAGFPASHGPRSCDIPPNKKDVPRKGPATSSKQIDLLDSLSNEDKPSSFGEGASRSVQGRHGPSRRTIPSTQGKRLEQEDFEDAFEEWGDFTDGPPSEPPRIAGSKGKPTPKSTGGRASLSRAPNKPEPSFQVSSTNSPSLSPDQIRPTNIPPPSVLLELFLRLLDQLQRDAVQSKKNLQDKERLEQLASLIFYTLKAAARVVAGRTLRWKRDNILSQSMRIGPARSGKPGGMKLNTVNKNEDIKERQEAVDVITLWRDRAALFNSVLQASGKRPVQVIAENVRVTTATASQGALKASHACALCGLKRDERLPKVDECVEDSFGEWWADHWGHAECKSFWESSVNLLDRR